MKLRKFILLMLVFLCSLSVSAQEETYALTGATGTVVDALTGDTLPLVQIYFMKPSSEGSIATSIGTVADLDGHFSVSNTEGYTTLAFQMLGYKTEMLTLRSGQMKKRLTVKMEPDVYGLQDIVVTPKNRKQKYKRKGNPAVELIKEVIAHKDSANVKKAKSYRADTYDRMSFAIENLNVDFNKRFWKQYMFIQNYMDTTGPKPMLTVSVREDNAEEYYQRKPHREKKRLTAKRIFGLEDVISMPTMQANIDAMFADVDIYEDNMDLMLNRFVSPLSSSLAVSYYQYYIMDTIMVDGESCIDLAFVPVNSQSYSFTGHLYILNDSTYKLKKYAINVPPHINLNFVSDYSIEQTFRREENGLWAPDRVNTYAKFYVLKKKTQIFAHQMKLYKNFDFEASIPDSVFGLMSGDVVVDKKALRRSSAAWDTIRPEPLTFYESSVYDMVQELKQSRNFNSMVQFADAMSSSYVSTTNTMNWHKSKWDFGPIWNTVSWNMLEGVRVRVGGTTTAKLNPHIFFNGYTAYGFQDKRPKGAVNLIYSFNKKKKHPYETPRHNIAFNLQYDLEEPGHVFDTHDRDHILMSIPTSKPTLKNMQYVLHARVNYMKEWPNHFSIRAGFDFQRNEPAGRLRYDKIMGYNSDITTMSPIAVTQHVPYYYDYSLLFELRYSPGSMGSVNRLGRESAFNMEKDAPVIRLDHWIGYLDDQAGTPFFYQRTEFSAEKRFWFSAFGHLDARIQTGIIWNKVPFTKLYMPPASTSIFLALNSFNQMRPMEFLMDQYVALYATYYFKGWILNRIPGINRLKLRGVVSFSGIYGGLSNKNNPYLSSGEGLYLFPQSATYDENNYWISGQTSSPIGKMPYMEMTAGFENIFKFFRIDYVRRLTYNEYLLPDGIHTKKVGAWGRNGVKVTFRFSL